MKKTLLMILLFTLVAPARTSLADDDWSADVNHMLQEFLSCKEPADDISPCNRFVGRALKRVYNINDFQIGDDSMTANQIAAAVKAADSNWTLLGDAGEQSVLDEAQGYANVKKAIIAVLPGTPNGHVALILPGSTTASGNWQLNAPNSASFFLHKPSKSYVGKPLSYAFEDPTGVLIYGRNF